MQARPHIRNLLSTAIDVAAAASAFLAAFVTVVGYTAAVRVFSVEDKLLGFVAAAIVAHMIVKPYRGSWRYVSIHDLRTILITALTTVALYTVAVFLVTRGENVPRSVIVLSFIYMVVAMAGTRIGYRMFVERMVDFPALSGGDVPAARRVLLCGFSDKAENFIRFTRRNRSAGFLVVGMLDDSPLNLGRTIQGVRVLGTLEMLDSVVSRLQRAGRPVSELIVTEVAPSRSRLALILEQASARSIRVSRIPDPTDREALTNSLLLDPRPIELEDLLDRPEVEVDLDRIASLIRGKVVLATGAGGSIGSELCRQIATFEPRRLVIADNSEFHLYNLDKELREKHPDADIVPRIVDVRDRQRVARTFAEFRPDIVFHAAALKHVPLMEENPLEAIKTNIFGTRNVADAAQANDVATLVMISTDKAVNPTSIMGATKRAAEIYCQSLDLDSDGTRFKTVRFGNVLGSNGSVVPRFQEQIAAGGPVTVAHPGVMRYFMTIPEAVRLVLQASAHALTYQSERGKILVLDMGEPVRILDLAHRMIQLAGFRPGTDIEVVFTGLRPGEKLSEELFDPREESESLREEGYTLASPRVVDRTLVERTLAELETHVEREDAARAVEVLARIVPEYRPSRP